MRNRLIGGLLIACVLLAAGCDDLKRAASKGDAALRGDGSGDRSERSIVVFEDNIIHFDPEDSLAYETVQVSALDRGRVIWQPQELRPLVGPHRIIARVTTRPIAQDIQHVQDPWDRAGNVRLAKAGMADVELVKFVTAYGGVTTHEVDVSHLAPLLQGPTVFKGFVDTWSSPGWKMDFSLHFEPVRRADNPDWARGLFYEESLTADRLGESGIELRVEIPDSLDRVVLNLLVSGHCTDGRGADEFESKDNIVTVDGEELARFRPWRDDCQRFRAVNPYCRRWSDGSWSSDYSRSGWCPGDWVPPTEFDLTAVLTPGTHTIRYHIEGVRPKDAEEHFGYWRVSAHLLGWRQ